MKAFIEKRTQYYLASGKIDEAQARKLAEREAEAKARVEANEDLTPDLFGAKPKAPMKPSGIVLRDIDLSRIKAKKRAAPVEVRPQTPVPATDPGQLPLWLEEKKPVSNLLVRSGIFGPEVRTKKLVEKVNGGSGDTKAEKLRRYSLAMVVQESSSEPPLVPLARGAYIESQQFHAWNSQTKVYFSGYRLNQNDLDVLTAVLEIIKDRQLSGERSGDDAFFTTSELLDKMGEPDSGRKRNEVAEALIALKKGEARITEKGNFYSSQLLTALSSDPEGARWYAAINGYFRAFFGESCFTMLDWRVRRRLSTGPAKWLHALYSTHAEPGPVSIDTLAHMMEIDVSTSTKKAKFRAKVKAAFAEITEAHKAVGLKFWGGIDKASDTVLVSSDGSASQRRHVAKRRNTA